MGLSNNLISQFVDVMNQDKVVRNSSTVYGTVKKVDNINYVQIDGSDLLTPIQSTTMVSDGERVTVMIKDHKAIITGNITSPATRLDDVEVTVGDKIAEYDIVITRHLQAESARIDELVSNNITVNGTLTAVNADIKNLKTEYLEVTKTLTAQNGIIENLTVTKLDAEEANIKFATIIDLEATTIKVNTIQGDLATFTQTVAENFVSTNATIQQLTVDKANVADLNATNATIQQLKTDVAYVSDLTAVNADIQNLKANKADVTTLDAAIADIGTLTSSVAQINNIIGGNITSDNIQTGGITGDSLNMDTIFVNDANIISVNASKINTGTINTSNVNIMSANGGISISDNVQQFRDKAGKVRVQIGQDARGVFSFGVFDETGTGVLIDSTGVKEKALSDGIIKDRMISTGEISGSKLNITSVITEINKDTNTSTIKGSKVLLDGDNQKLDVAFTNLKNQANDTKTKTESNTTQLGIEQGRINTLIQDTTIVKDGQNLKLKDEYSKLEQSVSGIKSTVAQQTTDISNVNSKVDSISVGGRNLVKNSNFSIGRESWSDWGAPTTREFITSNGRNWCHIIGSGTALYQGVSQNPGVMTVQANTEYTFSARVKSGNDKSVFTIGLHWNNSSNAIIGQSWNNFDIDQNEKIVTCLIKSPVDISIIRFNIMIGVNSTTAVNDVYFTDIKFEKGNKATDWSPAPEDSDRKLALSDSTLNEKITVVSNKHATLSQDLDGFKTTVGSTYSTKSELSTVDGKVTGLTSRVNTAESSITQLNNKIDLKVEQSDITSAIDTSKQYTNDQIITVNETITNSVAQIKLTTDGITQRVSNTESTLTSTTATANSALTNANNANNKIDRLTIGGRNLLLNSNFKKELTNWTASHGAGLELIDSIPNVISPINSHKIAKLITKLNQNHGFICQGDTLELNTEYTFSGWVYVPTDIPSNMARLSIYYDNGTGWNHIKTVFITERGKWAKANITFISDSTCGNTILGTGFSGITSISTIYGCLFKLEKGNKATDWSPAPEDIDSDISDVIEEISTTNNRVSEISTNLDSINLKVQSTQETVSSHATSIAAVDGKITSAVDTSKQYTNDQISTVNKTIIDKVAEIKLTTDSITQRVSNTESTLTSTTSTANSALTNANNANNKIDGLSVGGRNLISISNISLFGTTGTYNKETNTWTLTAPSGTQPVWGVGLRIINNKVRISYGQTYICSFEVRVPITCTWNVDVNNFAVSGTSWKANDNDNIPARSTNISQLSPNVWHKCWFKYENTNTQNTSFVDIYDNSNFGIINNTGSDVTFEIRNVKGEIGTKATDWTPCPEDVNASIDDAIDTSKQYTNDQIVTVNKTITDKVAEIKLTTDGITQRVSNAEGSITTVNGEVTSLKTRMQSAEQKITADAIISTVTNSTNWTSVSGTASSALNSATNANNKIDNLSVGGRNYLLNSKLHEITPPGTDNWDYPIKISDAFWRNPNRNTVDNIKISFIIYATKPRPNDLSSKVYFRKTPWYGREFTYPKGTTDKKRVELSYSITDTSYSINEIFFRFMKIDTAEYPIVIENLKLEVGSKTTDWSPAPEDVDSNISTVSNNLNLLTNRVQTAEQKITTDAIVSTVTSSSSWITVSGNAANALLNANTANSKIDNLSLGGTNLLYGTVDFSGASSVYAPEDGEYNKLVVIKATAPSTASSFKDLATWGGKLTLRPNTQYTLSFWAKATQDNTKIISHLFPLAVATGISSSGDQTTSSDGRIVSNLTVEWKRYWVTWTTPSSISGLKSVIPIRLSNGTTTSGVDVYLCGVKFEEGNKATDWSPAPEDFDNKIVTLEDKVSKVEINLNSITSRVSSTESTVTTINGEVTNLKSRVQSAEQKITADAIVSTVTNSTVYQDAMNSKANSSYVQSLEQKMTASSIITTINSAINDGTSSISTTQFVMDSNGFTIKNGALSMLNSDGVEILRGTSTGDLLLRGNCIKIKDDMVTSSGAGMTLTRSGLKFANPAGQSVHFYMFDNEQCLYVMGDSEGLTKNIFYINGRAFINTLECFWVHADVVKTTQVITTEGLQIGTGGSFGKTIYTKGIDNQGFNINLNGGMLYGGEISSSGSEIRTLGGPLNAGSGALTCGSASVNGNVVIGGNMSITGGINTNGYAIVTSGGNVNTGSGALTTSELNVNGPTYCRSIDTSGFNIYGGDILSNDKFVVVANGSYSSEEVKGLAVLDGSSAKYLQIQTRNGSVYGLSNVWVSDSSLKCNIKSVEQQTLRTYDRIGIDAVLAMEHYEFDYIDYDLNHVDCGYISQQLLEINKNFAYGVEQGDGSIIYCPDPTALIPTLSLAIKQQNNYIKLLEDRIRKIEECI